MELYSHPKVLWMESGPHSFIIYALEGDEVWLYMVCMILCIREIEMRSYMRMEIEC